MAQSNITVQLSIEVIGSRGRVLAFLPNAFILGFKSKVRRNEATLM